MIEVKINGPNQCLGPILAPKNEAVGPIPESKKNHVEGPIPQINSVVIPEQHFLSSGIGSQTQKLLSLGSDTKFLPIF